jgi:hypothetical protein
MAFKGDAAGTWRAENDDPDSLGDRNRITEHKEIEKGSRELVSYSTLVAANAIHLSFEIKEQRVLVHLPIIVRSGRACLNAPIA